MAAAADIVLPALRSPGWFVCAWCRSPMSADRSQSESRPEKPVENFGICPECLREQLAQHRRKSRDRSGRKLHATV